MFLSFTRTTTRDEAVTAIDENIADLVPAGRRAINNPDLVTRQRKGTSDEVGQASVYGGGGNGCTD